ncbi:MAG: glycoside hydrolase N-terminal domain-containing protein [Clostridia bacterium]|nr:glycoside hydrolase N-terminal domain-containing protein [Clostridia bacterium]
MDTKRLHFDETIEFWDDGLPLGNGDMGCLIWNSPDKLRFSLDKGGIWDCSDSPENQEGFTWANLKKLVAEGNRDEVARIFEDCYGRTTPTKLPAGKIILDLGVNGNAVSDLDYMTAEAKVEAEGVHLRAFLHAEAPYGLVEIDKTGIGVRIENPEFGKPGDPPCPPGEDSDSVKNLHYPPARFVDEEKDGVRYEYFIQQTNDRFYGIITARREEDGKTLLAFTVADGKEEDFLDGALFAVGEAVVEGYDESVVSHRDWWRKYWDKSSISIPDPELERQWYFNNYILAGCSRKGCYPMPLQGVWTADNGLLPPWKGDYHSDLNTQMSYTSYLKANRLEQGECFIDYLLDLSDVGRKFARNFYDCKGLCLPSIMDIEGHALGGWVQYSYAPANQFWLCQIMARYFYFTRDPVYFDRIYPFMKECGEFLLDILEEKDGVLKLPLSSSPELHDNLPEAWVTPNSNYDQALMRNFAEDMIRLSEVSGDEDEREKWEDALSRLEPVAIDERGVFMISPDEKTAESHRHHSHCMSIYPLKTVLYDTDEHRRVIDATVRDIENNGTAWWVGYSVVWMAEFYVAQGRGDDAARLLRSFFSDNCTKNGFHANGDYMLRSDYHWKYRLFTLEGNFIATDAIQDMLMFSEWGKLRLFPAIPSGWRDASFESFRGFGGILVDAEMKDGVIVSVTVRATSPVEVTVENDLSHLTATVPLVDGVLTLAEGETAEFTL